MQQPRVHGTTADTCQAATKTAGKAAIPRPSVLLRGSAAHTAPCGHESLKSEPRCNQQVPLAAGCLNSGSVPDACSKQFALGACLRPLLVLVVLPLPRPLLVGPTAPQSRQIALANSIMSTFSSPFASKGGVHALQSTPERPSIDIFFNAVHSSF